MEEMTAYLGEILDKLRERIEKIDRSLEEGEREIEQMHTYYWENYTEMDQYGYENYDNQQALLGQVNANQEQRLLRHRLCRMLDSPFFGRVDFAYEGEEKPETFYIGIGNFSQETGQVPLIYDWRAPVSSLFYDYDKGPACYQAPGGRMDGEVWAKWQYKIRSGKLVYAFESDLKIDDEVLQEELGTHGDVKLKNIIRTIQKEQNAIIRNTKDPVLVIQGVAGSGKTSVALHRIAYLLYHDRENLKSSNVLILSPNQVFSDYISRILPELGEENIQEMSFDLFAYRELQDVAADCEEKYDQIEKMFWDVDQSSYRQKQSENFMREMDQFVLELEDGLMQFQDVKYRGYQRSAGKVMEMFYYKFPDFPLLSRMDVVMEYFIDEYETSLGRDLDEDVRMALEEQFQRMYRTRDLYEIYNWFLKDYGYEPLPEVPWERRKLSYEDVYPLLYLKYQLVTCPRRGLIKHLVVDEMQDYSQMQYRILEKMFHCRMTILGDRAQTIGETPQDVTKFLSRIFGRNLRVIAMDKSYRNTVEIATYANKLAGVSGMELFERHGKPVEEKRFDCFEQAFEQIWENLNLTDEGFETGAVLTLTEEEALRAESYFQRRLSQESVERRFSCSYVDKESTSFQRGLTITTFYLAKGLEFDQVFAVMEDRSDHPLFAQAQYIMATRALHELSVYLIEAGGTGFLPDRTEP